jgi:polyisoprenoid-binding protein YceI
VSKKLGTGALALVLAACGAFQARHAGPRSPEAPVSSIDQGLPGTIYRVDETESELRILVYRAGPLARLGHNHVMVNRRLGGEVNIAGASGASAFWLNIPAAAFMVDDAQARAEEGADFAAAVPDDAKSGTLQNMLSAAVLDAAEFPAITVRSVAVASATGATGATEATRTMVVGVTVGVAGHESTIDVPFALQMGAGRLSATGTLELRQSTLGLTPYSLMLGALQVQDQMTVKFKIVAQAT